MTRHYETPAAFKQAVEQRLRDEAAGDGSELADAVTAFLDPLLAGTGGSWNPDTWSWIPV